MESGLDDRCRRCGWLICAAPGCGACSQGCPEYFKRHAARAADARSKARGFKRITVRFQLTASRRGSKSERDELAARATSIIRDAVIREAAERWQPAVPIDARQLSRNGAITWRKTITDEGVTIWEGEANIPLHRYRS